MSEKGTTRTSRVRLRDVADVAQVSVSVVSRVLNGDPSLRVRQEKRDRVHRVARQLGYRPNVAGRSLRTHSIGAIGVMVPKLTQPAFTELIQGVEDECEESDLTPILGRSERLQPGSSILTRMVAEGRVDGFVLQLPEDLEARSEIIETPVPRVLIHSHAMGLPGSVTVDTEAAVVMALDHLIELGHRNIGFATGKGHVDVAQVGEARFRQRMTQVGLGLQDGWITHTGFDFDAGSAAFEALCQQGERPTAIVAGDVNLGIGILQAAVAAGIDVPGSLSLISLHDCECAERTMPPMAAVQLPAYRLGREAVRHLREILAGGARRAIAITDPPPQLRARGSCAPPQEG
ncbi:MAG: LacI family DNA-binding transcriptional regulator [Beutenbergiaceae bacterium]